MPQLNDKLAVWLSEFHGNLAARTAKGYQSTIISARERLADLNRLFVTSIPEVEWVNEDLIITDDYNVPVRIYNPLPEQACPVLLFFHGGGHCCGSVSIYDPICRKLAVATGHIVISVEYRLAPENPYPCAVVDALNAAKGAFEVLDRQGLNYQKKLSLAGDSVGGALVTSVVSQLQSEETIRITNQVLIYPLVDYTMSHNSIDENADGYFLTKNRIVWYFESYFRHKEERYKASPLFGNFSSAMPRTLMISAEYDPLRDDAVHYLARLKEAGVSFEHLHFEDMIHAYLCLEDMVKDQCVTTYQTIANFLNGT